MSYRTVRTVDFKKECIGDSCLKGYMSITYHFLGIEEQNVLYSCHLYVSN